MRRAATLLAVLLLAACSTAPVPSTSSVLAPEPEDEVDATPSVSPSAAPSGACAVTDQDQYVYHPTRLTVLQSCLHISGTVAAIRIEADGDSHTLIKPDPAYANVVNAANSGLELGDLVVEPVCETTVTQTDAQAICATDHTQTPIAGLVVGQHVWMEGRYVTDSAHGGWAELHPLYR